MNDDNQMTRAERNRFMGNLKDLLKPKKKVKRKRKRKKKGRR